MSVSVSLPLLKLFPNVMLKLLRAHCNVTTRYIPHNSSPLGLTGRITQSATVLHAFA